MRTWQLQEAKSRFSEVVDMTLKEGPQLVTRRGQDAVAAKHLVQRATRHTLDHGSLARAYSGGRPVKYLLDTCFLSELVKTAPEKAVLSWMSERVESDLLVSAMTMAEIGRGIEKLPASRRQTELSTWLQQLKVGFENRVLAFTHEAASAWAHMSAAIEANGKPMAAFDFIIAATVMEHGLALVTHNVRDFAQAPVVLINPWPVN